MIILFISLTATFGLNTSLIIDKKNYSENIMMNDQNQIVYQQYEYFGKILSINFTGNDISKTFCKPFYQGVSITNLPDEFIPLITEQAYKDLDDLTENDLYIGYNENFISQARSPEGICILSSLGKVYLIEQRGQNKIQLKNHTLPHFTMNQELATLIYDEKSRHFFAFLKDHLIKFQFQQNQLKAILISNWVAPQNKVKFVASNGWLYCALEEKGLLIYKIFHDEVTLAKTITSYDIYQKTLDSFSIVDIAVEEDKLYILDAKNGISLFNIYFNGTFTKIENFTIINLTNAHSFSVKGQTMIVIQNFKSSSQVIEYYIKDYEWLEIRKYYTKSKLHKADIIDDNLVIVRGLHDHKILLTKMSEQYLDEQNHQLENYFFNGNLLGIEKYGEQNNTIIAISPFGLYFFTYIQYPTALVCDSKDAPSGQYNASMTLISTDCKEKGTQIDDLLYCQINFNYYFDIKRPLMSANKQQLYFYFGIGLIILIIALVLVIGSCYYRYKQQLRQLIKSKIIRRNIHNQLN